MQYNQNMDYCFVYRKIVFNEEIRKEIKIEHDMFSLKLNNLRLQNLHNYLLVINFLQIFFHDNSTKEA